MSSIGRWLITVLVGIPYFVAIVALAFHYFRTIVERLWTSFPG